MNDCFHLRRQQSLSKSTNKKINSRIQAQIDGVVMAFEVQLESSYGENITLSLDRPRILGRGATADLRLNDIWASREHCQLVESYGTVVVRDLGSTHGTLVNHSLIQEAVLRPGDSLSVGISRFRVSWHAAESAASSHHEPAEAFSS